MAPINDGKNQSTLAIQKLESLTPPVFEKQVHTWPGTGQLCAAEAS